MTELIIACDARAAETYAIKSGWEIIASGPHLRAMFNRRDRDGDEIRVHYLPHAHELRSYAHGSPIWLGPWPDGVPPEWLDAIDNRGHTVANAAEFLAQGFGAFRPMQDAPTDRPFLAWHIHDPAWTIITENDGQFLHYEQEYMEPPSCWICWRELPAPPPQFLIRAALESSHAEQAVTDPERRNSPVSRD